MWLTTASAYTLTPAPWQGGGGGTVAGAHHVRERRAVTAPGLDAVADRLVVLPPRISLARQHHVLLWRRDLDAAETLGAQDVHALARDRGPWPLEEVDDHVLRPRVGARRRRDRHGGGRGGVRRGHGNRAARDESERDQGSTQ